MKLRTEGLTLWCRQVASTTLRHSRVSVNGDGECLGERPYVALKADSRSHGEEWLVSRDWLFRACVLLILAYVLLLASYAFRPLLIPCLLVGIAYLYAAGRFAWHVQRNARNRQMAIARTRANPFLKLVAQHPVGAGLLMAVAWVVLGVAAVDLLRRTNG